MTTITTEKPKLTKAQDAIVKNAFAVLAHADSTKAKRQEALGALERLGVKADMAKPDTGAKAVIAKAKAKAEEKRKAIGKVAKGVQVMTLAEEREAANAKVEAAEASYDAAVTEISKRLGASEAQTNEARKLMHGWAFTDESFEVQFEKHLAKVMETPEAAPVTDEELKAAIELIKRMTGHQAEAVRKAAAEQKKIAPKGEKVKKVKELTEAQKKKLAEMAEKAETYGVLTMAAQSFVGKGLTMSKKMHLALNALPLPALRWLAKQYEGVAIPKEKRSKIDIADFLRVALLTWEKPYQFGDLAKMELKSEA